MAAFTQTPQTLYSSGGNVVPAIKKLNDPAMAHGTPPRNFRTAPSPRLPQLHAPKLSDAIAVDSVARTRSEDIRL